MGDNCSRSKAAAVAATAEVAASSCGQKLVAPVAAAVFGLDICVRRVWHVGCGLQRPPASTSLNGKLFG